MLYRKRPDEDSEKRTGDCELESPPPECRCADYSLFCESRGLTDLPKPIPSYAEYLDISGNTIDVLDSLQLPAARTSSLVSFAGKERNDRKFSLVLVLSCFPRINHAGQTQVCLVLTLR
ncbi:uncharacterized protein LOC122258322 [Penaeus japonicus]|uniref:uncharacterized protein LOC122258322 n=1 Tax=Penaeus japonicus TaxID=27405 RepID=UPI001C712474|nr:uncharacterized protein LOC122258322 [Penaeus japonicus]